MTEDNKKMTLYVITHGEHAKSAKTGEKVDGTNYDGHLTPKGIATVRELVDLLPEYEKAFSGKMTRIRETVGELGIKTEELDICGLDSNLFAVIDGNDEPIDRFWEWVLSLKEEGLQNVLIVMSRMNAFAILYKLGGGKEKFGTYMQFFDSIMAVTEMECAVVPLAMSGQLHRFEI